MASAIPYIWDFDRNPWDSRDEAKTFSVGVYQWLPKSSGDGLKKSKTIRVIGYIADSEAVYAKAEELKRRLNEEQAQFESPPSWLQKQYSVTKPDGLVVQRSSPDFTGSEARTIRNRVMKSHLLTQGFVQSHASTYVRRANELVQCINFQTATWGGKFTVNLGFHYTFVPLFRPTHPLEPKRWIAMEELDFAIRGRIGFFLPRGLDTWFKFGKDSAVLRSTFEECVKSSLDVFERFTPKLTNPDALLSGGQQFIAPFLFSFPIQHFAAIEMRLGRLDAAERRLKAPVVPENEVCYRPMHRQLLGVIAKLREARGDENRTRKLLRWVTD